MTNEELLERAVTDICNDARLSAKGQHGDYYRCVVSQAMAGSRATLEAELSTLRQRLAAVEAGWRKSAKAAKENFDGLTVFDQQLHPSTLATIQVLEHVADQLKAALENREC